MVLRDRAVFVGEDQELPVDPLEPSAHLEEAVREVDVLPSETQHLAATHAEEREDDEHRIEPVVP